MTAFAAFLRGINVGGHRKIGMAELRQVFEELGFTQVKTLLASGNVLFNCAEEEPAALTQRIEQKLLQAFGHEIGVILRSRAEIQALVDADPFREITVTPQTRLYITFYCEPPKSDPAALLSSGQKDFQVIRIFPGAVASVLTLSAETGTTESMKILEKVLGKKVTTRNWNTVLKVLAGWED